METISENRVQRLNFVPLAITLNLAYASYSTFLYSLIGAGTIIRGLLIGSVILIDLFALLGCFRVLYNVAGLFFIFGALLIGTYLTCAANRWVIELIGFDVVKYLFLAFFLSVYPIEKTERAFLNAAWIILICCMTEPLTKYVTSQDDGYMVFGMRVLNAALIFVYFSFKERRVPYYLASVASILLVILYGNRSAMFISFLSVALMMILFSDPERKRLTYMKLVIGALCGIILLSGEILEVVGRILEWFGVSSRTISLLQTGVDALMDNNGRSIIWENARKAISERLFTGYGIGGERNLYLLGSNYVSRLGGIYAHNFIYELMLDFGVVIGGLVVLYLLYNVVRIIRDKNDNPHRNLFAVISIATIVKLSFSSSIWADMNFYICIGIAMNYYRCARIARAMCEVSEQEAEAEA